jgi:ADP-ribosylglycohydrolase
MASDALLLPEVSPLSEEEELFPRVAGALIGAAAGDALGWITEFVRGRDHLLKLYKTDYVTEYRSWQKNTGGRFNTWVDYISKGDYSDDTQLTLATARAIRASGTFDVEHFSKRELPMWRQYARGAGSTITSAAKAISRKSASWNQNFFAYRHRGGQFSYRDAGANGAAMRIAPIALANITNQATMVEGVWKNAVVTHGHPRAILGALLHAEALRQCIAFRPVDRRAFVLDLQKFVGEVRVPPEPEFEVWLRSWGLDAFEQAWRACQAEVQEGLRFAARFDGDPEEGLKSLGCFEKETKGSGTGTVLAGLMLFNLYGDDPRMAVLTAVNSLGADTDTIAGFVGGLCGALHGYNSIPADWAAELQDYDYLMRVGTELASVASGMGSGGTALLPARSEASRELPDLLTLLARREVSKDERVYHPLFGPGWVAAVDAQKLRRKDGAEVVTAWTSFDIGQSAKFHFMRIPKRGKEVERRQGSNAAPKKGPQQTSSTTQPKLDLGQ